MPTDRTTGGGGHVVSQAYCIGGRAGAGIHRCAFGSNQNRDHQTRAVRRRQGVRQRRRLRARAGQVLRGTRPEAPAESRDRRPQRGAAERARHGRVRSRPRHPASRSTWPRATAACSTTSTTAATRLRCGCSTTPPPNNLLDTPEHAGDGFLFRNGFTVVWSGWIPDSMLGPRAAAALLAPVAAGPRAEGLGRVPVQRHQADPGPAHFQGREHGQGAGAAHRARAATTIRRA